MTYLLTYCICSGRLSLLSMSSGVHGEDLMWLMEEVVCLLAVLLVSTGNAVMGSPYNALAAI